MERPAKPIEQGPVDEVALRFMEYHLALEEPLGYYENVKASKDMGAGTWARFNFDSSDTSSAWFAYFAGGGAVAQVYWDAELREMELYELKSHQDGDDMPLIASGSLSKMVRLVEARYQVLDQTIDD